MPLLFEIYDHGRRLTDYKVRGAFVVGPESVPMPGALRFEEGLLRVDTGSDPHGGAAATVDPGDEPNAYSGLPGAALDAVGICLLWGCAAGEYLLETTRLPPRSEPYVLNVELARHRLMKLLHKQEDWNLWDLPPAGPAVAKARQAQAIFAESLGLLHDPAAAAGKADEALVLALEAGEELAVVHGELLLARRRRNGLPRTMFAIRADTSEQAPRNAAYRAAMVRSFDCVNVPMPWRQMQPDEDVFATGAVDSTVEFLARNRVPMIAGPLLDLSEGQVPEWLFIYEHDFETLRDLAFEYVKSVVTRYRRVIKLWNVTAGLHASGSFGLTFEQMVELTRLLVAQVKAVLPSAKTLVSVRQPYGEYLSLPGAGEPGASTAVPPMLYAEMVSQSGVQVDGFGVEIVTGRAQARPLLPRPLSDQRDARPLRDAQQAAVRHRRRLPRRREHRRAAGRPRRGGPLAPALVARAAGALAARGGEAGAEQAVRRNRQLGRARRRRRRDRARRRAARRPAQAQARLRRLGRPARPPGPTKARRRDVAPSPAPLPVLLVPRMRRPTPDPDAPPTPDRVRWLPDAPQRGVLAGLIVLASLALLAQVGRRPALFADPPPAAAARAGEVRDTLDPNIAPAAQLAELPGIGPSKAEAIVAWRESAGATPAFRRPEDLARVRGIGPATVGKIAPFLHFAPPPPGP